MNSVKVAGNQERTPQSGGVEPPGFKCKGCKFVASTERNREVHMRTCSAVQGAKISTDPSNDLEVVAEVAGGDVGTAGLEYKPNVQASNSNSSTSNSNATTNAQQKQGEKTGPKEMDEDVEIFTNYSFESKGKDDDDDFEAYTCGFERCFFETPFAYDVVEHMSGEHGKSFDCELLNKKKNWKEAKKVFKCLKCDFKAPKESREAI